MVENWYVIKSHVVWVGNRTGTLRLQNAACRYDMFGFVINHDVSAQHGGTLRFAKRSVPVRLAKTRHFARITVWCALWKTQLAGTIKLLSFGHLEKSP